MKITRLIWALAIMLVALPSWATFTRTQHAFSTTCASASTTCAVTTSSTGAGHVIVASAVFGAAGLTITAVSAGGTFQHCTNCAGSDTTNGRATDIWYTLNSTSGVTSITITRSAASGGWFADILEYSFGAGNTVAVDASNNIDDNTASLTQPGVALTLSGTNDVIVQVESSPSNFSSISSPYTKVDPSTSTTGAFAESINTSSGSAPTWTLATSGRLAGSAIAIKEISSCPHSLSLLGAGCS